MDAHTPISRTLTHAGGDQSASGVERQSYTTTATPAGSATIPQALRERSLERFIISYALRYSRMRAQGATRLANLISAHVDIMRLIFVNSKAEHGVQ